MPQKYLHYFGNEASESLLEAYGIVTKNNQQKGALRPKQCPNCNEPNKPDGKFCAKCRMVLTYDAYNETLEKEHNKDSEVKLLKEKYENDMKAMRDELKQEMRSQISQLIIKLKPEIIQQGLS
jgi:predicted amidophosphoribosyltransferase